MDAEVVTARGSQASLDARMSVIHNADGTLKTGADAEVVTARGSQASLDARMSVIHNADGTLKTGADAEVVTARGSKASLHERLDITQNADGTLKAGADAEVVTARGSKASLNDRLNAALNDDGTLRATAAIVTSQWVLPNLTFIYVGANQFKIVGDQTDIYQPLRRLKITLAAGAIYSEVIGASYSSSYTTVTIRDSALDNTLTTVEHSLILPYTSAADGGKSALSQRMLGIDFTPYAKSRMAPTLASAAVKTWLSRASASDESWRGSAWSPELGLFCAVATSGKVMTSPDGVNWDLQTPAAYNSWTSVAWSPELGLFVAVANSGTGNRVMTSPDGTAWTIQASAADNFWSSVVWAAGLGLFVAVADSIVYAVDKVMISPDGVNWTGHVSADDYNSWSSVAWSPELGLLVAVSNQSGPGIKVMTSINGTAWTQKTGNTNGIQWASIAWSPELGLFVAVAQSGGTRVVVSSDGSTWTLNNMPQNYDWENIAWSRELGLFVAVANMSAGDNVATSFDGVNWTSCNAPDTNYRGSVCWSPQLGIFVITSTSGAGNRVMTSSGISSFGPILTPDLKVLQDPVGKGAANGLGTLDANIQANETPNMLNLAPDWSMFRNLTIQNNATNPSFQLDVAAAAMIVQDATGNYKKLGAVAHTVDSKVSGANGLDTGTLVTSTWYHIWIIAKADGTTAALLSLSTTAPTMPSGYTFMAYVGAVSNGLAPYNLLGIKQSGRFVDFTTNVQVKDGTFTVNAWTSISVGNFFPPSAKMIKAVLLITNTASVVQQAGLSPFPTGDGGVYFMGSSPTTVYTGTMGGIFPTARHWGPVNARIQYAASIYYYTSNAGSTIMATGWEF